MSRFVEVNISDETTPVTQAGFGLGLIFEPTGTPYDYTEVRSADDIPADAGELAEDMARAYLRQTPNAGVVAMVGKDVETSSVSDELADLDEQNWYGLLLASREQAEIEDAATFVTDQLFITQPVEDDWTALQGYDLAGYSRVGIIPSTTEQEADAAWMGRMFATDPGSATWKWKQLDGVSTSGYESADVSNMLEPGEGEPSMNPVIWEMGVDYTAEGKSADGSFLDVQRSIDWMTARVTENVFQLLVNADKVKYDDSGINRVVSRLQEILQQAFNREVIAADIDGVPMYSIDKPRRSDIPSNDIANRILPDINFDATIAGAIHEVEIAGVLKV